MIERTQTATVPVLLDTLRRLVEVAAHVSRGRSAADAGRYPDAAARRALGELDDAGLLALAAEPVEPEPRPATTLPCAGAILAAPHPGHSGHTWVHHPGVDPVWCPGTNPA